MRTKAAFGRARIVSIGGLALAAWVAGCRGDGGSDDDRAKSESEGGNAAGQDTAGAPNSGDEANDGGGAGSTAEGFGRDCRGSCNGTVCATGDPLCSDSDLDSNLTCIGTATGMYCSRSCRSDEDCTTPQRSMRCIVSCPGEPGGIPIAGVCWSADDYEFLTRVICDESLGTGGTSGVGGASGSGGAGGPSGTGGLSLNPLGEGCPETAPEPNTACTAPNPSTPMLCLYADMQCACVESSPIWLCN